MSSDIQKAILKAAGKRFAHYGYSKTSMAEIAKDCDMSVGNLYRFYKNKEAIALAGANACFREKAELSEAAAEQYETAFEQLYAYFQARLEYMHTFVSETPHMQEVVELITNRHQELIQSYEERTICYLAEIIRKGQLNISLNFGDTKMIAADLYRATYCFNMPFCMHEPLAEKEAQLKSLLKTMFKGLENREGKCENID